VLEREDRELERARQAATVGFAYGRGRMLQVSVTCGRMLKTWHEEYIIVML
jgi:hypothetical protein